MRERASHIAFDEGSNASKRVRKGKGLPSDVIWRKNADAVVNECRRKAGEKSEIMITVLTWFTDRFLWSRSSVTEAIPSFGSFPQMFSYPCLTFVFYRARIILLLVVALVCVGT